MYVTLVNVWVKPSAVEDFIAATRKNHEASILEEGNLRFDILRSQDDASTFVLYEAYVSAGHAAAHKQTSHYLEWRDSVAEWMAKPRQATVYTGIFPQV